MWDASIARSWSTVAWRQPILSSVVWVSVVKNVLYQGGVYCMFVF
jgi:hypothetical protein